METTRFSRDLRDACSDFWWQLYHDRPYVHRPDGYDWVNGTPMGPHYFARHLGAGLSNKHTDHWQGDVTDGGIFVAMDRGMVCGLLVTAIQQSERVGSVLSAFAPSDVQGRQTTDRLLDEALAYFRDLELTVAVAAPPTRTVEVQSPLYLSLMDAGFGWDKSRWPHNPYGVFLGGSIAGFRVGPHIRAGIERLRRAGIAIRRCSPEEAGELLYHDSDTKVGERERKVRAIAEVDGRVVGHAVAETATEWAEEPPNQRIWGESIPLVLPAFRDRGVGKALYHLGVEWLVETGATCTYLATDIDNPAQFIYRSTPLRYWYTSVCCLVKRLA